MRFWLESAIGKFVLFTGWFSFVSVLQGVGSRFCCWTSCDGWSRSPRPPLLGRQRKSVHLRIFGKFRLWFQQTPLRNLFRIERTAPGARLRGSSSALSNCKPGRISCHKAHNGGAYRLCIRRNKSRKKSVRNEKNYIVSSYCFTFYLHRLSGLIFTFYLFSFLLVLQCLIGR